MSVRVQNAQTGEVLSVTPEEAARLYQSGQYRVEKGASLPMRNVHGSLVSVSPEQLDVAQQEGFEYATQEEWDAADKAARYGSTGQVALTAAEGVGRGLSLGTYDAIAYGVSPEYAKDVRARSEANPVAAIGGEVVGMVAPLVISGGSSAAVRGATALPRLAARGGRVAEGVASRALGEGATATGRIARAAGSKAVGGAVESLPYALGRGLSTAVVEDDVSAQRLLAQIGLETIAGGLAGGILGGAGRATREGYEAVAARLFGDAAHPGLGKAAIKLSSQLSGESEQTLSRLALGKEGQGLLSKSAREAREIGFFEGDAIRQRVTREMSEAMPVLAKKLDDIAANAPATSEVVEAQMRHAAATRDLVARTNILKDPEAIARQLDQVVDAKDLAPIRSWVQASEDLARVTGRGLDDVAAMRKIVDEAADSVVLANQTRILSQSIQSESSALSPLAMGASFALDTLAPLGGLAAVGSIKKVVQAAQTPGAMLKKLASLERVVQTATKRLDDASINYVKSIGSRAPKAAEAVTRAAARASFESTRKRIEEIEQMPQARKAAVEKSMSTTGSPQATEAMVARVQNVDAYLSSKMPRAASINPWTKNEPSDADVVKFMRHVAAAEDPIGTVTKELERGNLTYETMDTVRALYPSIAEQVTANVVEQLQQRKTPPPYQDVVQLSLLLGTPLDESLRPEKIAQIQESYTWSDQGHPGGTGQNNRSTSIIDAAAKASRTITEGTAL